MANMNVPNRLSKKKSLYLLQHQYNPADWFPLVGRSFCRGKG